MPYKIENLNFYYKMGSEKIQILHEINLSIPKGALVCLSGPSGSGKSTLLNILGLIEPMQEGTLYLEDEEITALPNRRKNRLRRYDIGFIFQQFHLFPILTVEENIAYFLKRQKLPKAEIKKRCEEAMAQVSLLDHRKKKPDSLSGGQRQRVAIARAIAKKPRVIIADELTASLDQKTGREIMEDLSALARDDQVSVVIATHDPMVLDYADYHYHLLDGKLASQPVKEEKIG